MSDCADRTVEKSTKDYGLAVALCGIFGTLGVHHFYLGNWPHGLFDVGLVLLFLVFWWIATPGFWVCAVIVAVIDLLHTAYVFYRLIIGKQFDGKGRLITLSN